MGNCWIRLARRVPSALPAGAGACFLGSFTDQRPGTPGVCVGQCHSPWSRSPAAARPRGGLAAEPNPCSAGRAAVGEVLRIVTVNDVYKLDNYPDLAGFLRAVRATAAAQRCA